MYIINGTAGDDSLLGTEYADSISGLDGNDYLTGEDGGDILQGGAGSDQLYGGAGNDTLDGGGGTGNTLDGGAGSDTYIVSSNGGQSFIYNFDHQAGDVDTVFFTDTDLTSLHCTYINGAMVLTWGNGNQLNLYGQPFMGESALHFRIRPDAGASAYADYTPAQFLEQILIHVDSSDPSPTFSHYAEQVQGTAGDDILNLSGGNDTVSGGGGNDALGGDEGDDVLDGGSGQNVLSGGAGNDLYIVRSDGRQDLIYNYDTMPGDADTVLFTDVDLQSLHCRVVQGDMVLSWGNGNQLTLSGQLSSPDTAVHFRIKPHAGAADYLDYTPAQFIEQVLMHLDDAGYVGSSLSEQVQASASDDILRMDGGNDMAAGGSGNDDINGGDGNDSLNGEAGDDMLYGDAGNDTLDGGSGSNWLEGGQGDDVFMVHSDGRQDWIYANNKGAGDTDTVCFSDVALADMQMSLEDGALLLSWAGGNAVRMEQFGSAPAIDTFSLKLAAADAGPTSLSFEQLLAHKALHLADGGISQVFTAYGERVVGGNGDDVLMLLDGDNWADGADGNDNLFSGSGADELYGGSGNDVLDSGDGTDLLDGGAGDDILAGKNGNDVLRGGKGYDYLWLGDGDDTVLVAAGDGYDQLHGDGGGEDTLVFEALLRSSVTASRVGDDLQLFYGEGDEIYIMGQFDPAGAIEQFRFADGSYSAAELIGV